MGGGGDDEMASLPIPDELLEEILLRLPTPADLVRASAACVSFRSVATHCSFPRRYRKLHAPPLLGFFDYNRGVFRPAIAPHPSASAARAVALAADFSFSFLPAPTGDWVVRDMCDGRALLDRAPQHDIDNRFSVIFGELVVCDPLHRRQNDGGSQWNKVKTISLDSWAHFIYSMEKYLLLYLGQPSLLGTGCFTLDIKTFQLEKVGAAGSTFNKLHPYSNFPPSMLSSPTISRGVKIGAEKEMLEQGCVASSSAQSPRSE